VTSASYNRNGICIVARSGLNNVCLATGHRDIFGVFYTNCLRRCSATNSLAAADNTTVAAMKAHAPTLTTPRPSAKACSTQTYITSHSQVKSRNRTTWQSSRSSMMRAPSTGQRSYSGRTRSMWPEPSLRCKVTG